MKILTPRVYYVIGAMAMAVLLLASCKKQAGGQFKTFTMYTPVYTSKAAALASINGNKSEPIAHAGKIYIKDNFIYLNDVNKGIHIFDNSNPANPVKIAFLSIPGNLDIAIKQNVLYADMYTDLLTLDISNPRNARLTNRLEGFFDGRAWVYGKPSCPGDQVAKTWIEKDTTVDVSVCSFCEGDGFTTMPVNSLASSGSSTGTAGSMAAMVLMNDYLYAITERHSVGIVDIANAAQPVFHSVFNAGFDLETIYPFKGKIFLGSQIGMYMYDVSNPANPVSLGEFQHGRACDPVIADDVNAYVTLHAGDGCGGSANELHVLDVSNLPSSTLLKSYPMTKPKGLSKDGNLLFVCDGDAVKLFNAANPSNLVLLKQIPSTEPYDVITGNNRAIVVCEKGLYQYDYRNVNTIRQLSVIPVKR